MFKELFLKIIIILLKDHIKGNKIFKRYLGKIMKKYLDKLNCDIIRRKVL